MAKKKSSEKDKPEKADVNWLSMKVGDDVINGHIATIFYATPGYIIYTTTEAPSVLSYLYNDDRLRQNILRVMPALGRLRALFSSETVKLNYFPQIASAYALCFDNDIVGANSVIEDIISDIEQHNADRNNAQLAYQGICFLLVVINIIIALIFRYRTDIPASGFWIYFKVALSGSFGGFLSITYKLNKYEYDFNTSGIIRILSASSRIFIAMLSSVIVLWLIKSNIAFGFLNDIKGNDNSYVLYTFAVLSGFSESFVPDLLKVLERKSVEVKEPVKQT